MFVVTQHSTAQLPNFTVPYSTLASKHTRVLPTVAAETAWTVYMYCVEMGKLIQ